MVYIISKKAESINEYKLSYSKLLSENFPRSFLNVFLYSDKANDSYEKRFIDFCPSDYFNKYINFCNDISALVLKSIKSAKSLFLTKKEIAQGIVAPQENLNKSNQKILGADFNQGAGIFVLTNDEVERLNIPDNEKDLVKPFYTTEQLRRYNSNSFNEFNIIYTKSNINGYIQNYPVIKKHLDQYTSIITSDNSPYGLHRAREENFFIGEKIISHRKCLKPTFTYVNFDAYVSQTFYVIKSTQFKAKYLVAILNSKLIEFWLLNMGKMQGNNFQIDKEPLINIPIAIPTDQMEKDIIEAVEQILAKEEPDSEQLEKRINSMVYKLYGLTNEEIKIVEGI